MEKENYIFKARENIENILFNNKPIQTGITVQVFPNKTFDVYEVPLEFLKFNPYNDRIASYIKSYEFENSHFDMD